MDSRYTWSALRISLVCTLLATIVVILCSGYTDIAMAEEGLESDHEMHAGVQTPEEASEDLVRSQVDDHGEEEGGVVNAQSANFPAYEAGTTGVGMDGVDISRYQSDFANSGWTNYQFAIVKATEGISLTSTTVTEQATKVLDDGKLLGFYHYASGSGAVAEADYFVSVVRPYIGRAVLALDWEGNAVGSGPSYAKVFLDRVYELTGVKPLIYMSRSVTNNYDWSEVANAGYGLWVARYLYRYDNTWLANNASSAVSSYGYTEFLGYARDPSGADGTGAWGSPVMYQYSSTGKVGYSNGHLDIDKFYGSASDWNKLATPENSNQEPIGCFDSCSGGLGTITVRGWAFDPDEPAKNLGIHVYMDGSAGIGQCIGAGTADAYRPDVDNVYHTGVNHGFEFTVECPSGTHAIYVHAIDTAGGNNPYLGGSATSDGAITISVEEPPPSSGARSVNIGGGTYHIQSKIGSRLLEVEGAGSANGTNIHVMSVSGKARQRWQISWNSGRSGYAVQNAATGKYLDAEGGDDARIANVSQYESANTKNNNWIIEDAGQGWVYIKDLLGYYLDVQGGSDSDGANVQAYIFNGSDAQKWKIITADHQGKVVTDLPEGVYNIKIAAAPNVLVDVDSASLDEGANIQIWEENGSLAQEFRFERNDDGSYVITNTLSNLSLNVYQDRPDNNTNVIQSQTHRKDNQCWWLEDAGNGAYYLRVKHNGLYLDVLDGSTSNGANIQVHIPNGSDAQRFLLERVDDSSGDTHSAGDINGDGSVDNKDLTRLFQYLSDWEVQVVEENLDTNGDGSVNNKDLTRLFQYLSDWDVELHGVTG